MCNNIHQINKSQSANQKTQLKAIRRLKAYTKKCPQIPQINAD